MDEGPDKPFFDLSFIDAQRGFAAGAYGLLFATADGGQSWRPLPARAANPQGLHLYGLRATAGQLVVAGEQGLLMRSVDGGASFEALPSPYKGSFLGLLQTPGGHLVAHGLRGSAYRVGPGASRWDRLESQTAATLDKAGVGSAPVYVSLPAKPSAFDQGFREFLITKMVQGGKQVLTTPNPQALEVSYQTQVVRHNSPRPHFIPGGFTMLAGGLIAAYGLRHEHIDAKLFAALAGTGALDYANSINSGGPTATELILTTTVTRGGQYLARKTDVYYLENADTPLFTRPSYKNVNMKVVSQ